MTYQDFLDENIEQRCCLRDLASERFGARLDLATELVGLLGGVAGTGTFVVVQLLDKADERIHLCLNLVCKFG